MLHHFWETETLDDWGADKEKLILDKEYSEGLFKVTFAVTALNCKLKFVEHLSK